MRKHGVFFLEFLTIYFLKKSKAGFGEFRNKDGGYDEKRNLKQHKIVVKMIVLYF